jgi:hypothetical protein
LRGYNNTEFYHHVANGKKRKQTIFSMKCGDENIIGAEALLVHANEYYKTFFGPGMGNAFALDPSLWQDGDGVTRQENVVLTQPFSEEELRHALNQMDKNKASGTDEIHIEFYQHCWGIVKWDILEMFTDL